VGIKRPNLLFNQDPVLPSDQGSNGIGILGLNFAGYKAPHFIPFFLIKTLPYHPTKAQRRKWDWD